MKPRTRLLLALASVLVVGYVAAGLLLGRAMGDSTYGQLAVFNEVIRTVMDAYVDPIDVDRAMAGARTGLTDSLDGDSAYLSADEFKAWEQGVKAEGDIGAVLTRRFSFLAVVSVLPGSPAE
jgi:C-terminal processing protease CtpA/Prc